MKTIPFKTAIVWLGASFLFNTVTITTQAGTLDPPAKRGSSTTRTSKKIDLRSVKVRNIQFGFNRSTLNPNSYANLDKVAKLMAENDAALQLSGHADNKGAYVYNWKLSQARANSVKAYLVSKGADSARIAATEFGDTKPIASNQTKTGRQKNRRVEVNFVQ